MSNDNKALAIIPRSLDDVRALAKTLSESALIPDALRNKAADVFVSILAGQELGLPPMAALRGVHVVKGKPVLAADTMVGIVLGSGLAEYFSCVEETAQSVTYETKRRGSPHSQVCTWTLDDAAQAGLMSNDSWKKYPRAMLKARCKAMLARDVYPDALAGCYDEDEARAFTPSEPPPRSAPVPRDTDVVDAEVVSETRKDEPGVFADIDIAPTRDALLALVPIISKLPEETKKAARVRYGARLKHFEQLAAAGAA